MLFILSTIIDELIKVSPSVAKDDVKCESVVPPFDTTFIAFFDDTTSHSIEIKLSCTYWEIIYPNREVQSLTVAYLDEKIYKSNLIIEKVEKSIILLKDFKSSLISNVVTLSVTY